MQNSFIQTLNINIINTPVTPNAGEMMNSGDLSPTVIAFSVLGLALLLLVVARLLCRGNQRIARRITALSLVILPLLTIPTIVLTSESPPQTLATSNISSVTPTIDFNIYKDALAGGPLTKTADSITEVTTDSGTGYTLSARLEKALTNNFSVDINSKPLTVTDVDIYSTSTADSPSVHDNDLTVTVPKDIELGTYSYNIIYDIVENPYTSSCGSGPQHKGFVGDMQNFDTSSWVVGDISVVKDTRDNQEYCIGKLKDGKTWMLDNLKFELKNGVTLTPQDTNVKSNTTVYFTKDGKQDGAPLTGMTGNFTTSGYLSVDGKDIVYSKHANLNAWRQVDPSNESACKSNSQVGNINGGIVYNTWSKTGCGYLYNFYTASAGTVPSSQINGSAASSICPAGWIFPTGHYDSDLEGLDLAYPPGIGYVHEGMVDQGLWLSAGAWRGTLSGVYVDKMYAAGTDGYYWASTVFVHELAAYTVFIQSNGKIIPGTTNANRNNGFAIRCVVR
ncbi:MAG: fibrobacter succinogenes major paralogous domain-containing protein [Candidatus Nomurabacteria bacterium]|jgi:uncharacterized protein (TIGR02145 family)|nr:fibrobacter succinogenes major paralogous domain-containing protein [Candidatus Nomurabacteria bacterium]